MNFSHDALPVSTVQKQQFVLFENQTKQIKEDTFYWYVSDDTVVKNATAPTVFGITQHSIAYLIVSDNFFLN